MQSHHNLYTNTPTLNINISPNSRYDPPPINKLSERSNNLHNKSSFISYTNNNVTQSNNNHHLHPTKVTTLYKRRSNALEMYVSDMNEIDINRSKEFNIPRNIDVRDLDNDNSNMIYRRKEKEILL